MKTKLTVSNNIFFFIVSFWMFIIAVYFFRYHPVSLDIHRLLLIEGKFSMLSFMHLLIDYTISSIALIFLATSAYFFGNLILSSSKLDLSEPESLFFSIVTGLMFLTLLTSILGISGLLYAWIFRTSAILSGAAGMLRIYFLIKTGRLSLKDNSFSAKEKTLFILLIIPIAFNFLMCFTPEMFYDTLNYHLGVPNYYIQNSRIQPVLYKIVAQFPLNISLLYTFSLLVKGVMLAKLTNFLFAVLSVFGIILFAKHFFKNRISGLIASLIFYCTPTIIYRSWTASNDIGLTLFVFSSIFAVLLFFEKDDIKHLLLSAVFAGFAMGSKYTASFFFIATAITIIFHNILKKRSIAASLKQLTLFSLIAIAVFSPWLIRNLVNTGNPFHPLMSGYFKIHYPYNVSEKTDFNYHNPAKQASKLQTLYKIPWDMSIKGGSFKGKYGSPDYYMAGAVFLTFLPLLLFFRFEKNLYVKELTAFFLISYIIWAIAPNTKFKYFSPAIPVMSLLAGLLLSSLKEHIPSLFNISFIYASIMTFSNFLYMIPLSVSIYRPVSLLSGSISWDYYLSDSRPTYPYPSYAAYNFINDKTSKESKILIFGDAKTFYLNRAFEASSVEGLNPFIEILRNSKSGEDVFLRLKSEGFTHLVVNIPEAVKNGVYGNLYFEKSDIAKLDEFWKKHCTEIFKRNGIFVYSFSKVSTEPAPYNTVKDIIIRYRLNRIRSYMKSKKWDNALSELNDLKGKDITNDMLSYLSAVCSYNLGDYKNAFDYANIAYRSNPKEEYKKIYDAAARYIGK